MNKVIYVAELDQDVDDVIAAQYLFDQNVLDYVVLDPYPKTSDGKNRMKLLSNLGIELCSDIKPRAEHVFVGGSLTAVARYLQRNTLTTIVMNGGFVGCNIRRNPLPKFNNKKTIRTFNFNVDVWATDFVLKTPENKVNKIILVGKNVCHDYRNTGDGIWKSDYFKKLFDTYSARPSKLQHDLLACHEGLALINQLGETYCRFEEVYPYNDGLDGNMTKWGSKTTPTLYRKVLAAVDFKK